MVYLKCSSKVLARARMKAEHLLPIVNPSETTFGHWSVLNFLSNNRHVFVYVSEYSLLSFAIVETDERVMPQGLVNGLTKGLGIVLDGLGCDPVIMDYLLNEVAEVAITRLDDPTQTAIANSVVMDYRYYLDNRGGVNHVDMIQMFSDINHRPRKAMGYGLPIEMAQELIAYRRFRLEHVGTAH